MTAERDAVASTIAELCANHAIPAVGVAVCDASGPMWSTFSGSAIVHRTRSFGASHIAGASRLVGVVHDDRDVHPVGDVELGEQARYV